MYICRVRRKTKNSVRMPTLAGSNLHSLTLAIAVCKNATYLYIA